MDENNLIKKMCGSKKRFISEKAANNAKRGLECNRDAHNPHNVYQCPFCHYWHIGRAKIRDVSK